MIETFDISEMADGDAGSDQSQLLRFTDKILLSELSPLVLRRTSSCLQTQDGGG